MIEIFVYWMNETLYGKYGKVYIELCFEDIENKLWVKYISKSCGMGISV